MGLGSTAKKLQTVAERAEKVYQRMNKLRDEVAETQQTVDETKAAVESLEDELREQRALLDAIAEEKGIDADAVAAETHISEAEEDSETTESADGSAESSGADDR